MVKNEENIYKWKYLNRFGKFTPIGTGQKAGL